MHRNNQLQLLGLTLLGLIALLLSISACGVIAQNTVAHTGGMASEVPEMLTLAESITDLEINILSGEPDISELKPYKASI